jgi:hypothetical protein
MTTILELAREGNRQALLDRLEPIVRRIHLTGTRAQELPEHDKLMEEALTYARLGDLDEAAHRLKLWHEPKWHSPAECLAAYLAAMAEKNGVAA